MIIEQKKENCIDKKQEDLNIRQIAHMLYKCNGSPRKTSTALREIGMKTTINKIVGLLKNNEKFKGIYYDLIGTHDEQLRDAARRQIDNAVSDISTISDEIEEVEDVAKRIDKRMAYVKLVHQLSRNEDDKEQKGNLVVNANNVNMDFLIDKFNNDRQERIREDDGGGDTGYVDIQDQGDS